MKFRKYAIAVVVIAMIYLGISYLLSSFYGRDFDFGIRLVIAFGFGILITLAQVFITKKKATLNVAFYFYHSKKSSRSE